MQSSPGNTLHDHERREGPSRSPSDRYAAFPDGARITASFTGAATGVYLRDLDLVTPPARVDVPAQGWIVVAGSAVPITSS